VVALNRPIIAEYGRQKYFYCIAPAKVLLYIDVMQRVKRNLIYVWRQISIPIRILIFFALVVLLCFLVAVAFAWGILLALAVIGGALIFFPAVCAIGFLLQDFHRNLWLYFILSIFAIIIIGLVMSTYNISPDICAFAAISIVGWTVILIAFMNFQSPST
jgi:hypothetical protein